MHPFNLRGRFGNTTLFVATCVFLSGCGVKQVHVPPPNQDMSPQIYITAFPVGGTNVESQEMKKSGQSNVDLGGTLMFSTGASNVGGVKTLTIAVTQGAAPLYNVDATNLVAADGTVPDQLQIFGYNPNNASTPGGGAMNVVMSATAVATATATNFNGGTTSINVTYVPVDPSLRGKLQSANIMLQPVLGQNHYTAFFPTTPINGTVANFYNPNGFWLLFPRPGHTTTECFSGDPNAMVQVFADNRPYDLTGIYGTATPSLPIQIDACAQGNPGTPIPLTVYWTPN